MKKKVLFAVLMLILVLSLTLVACDGTQTYKITFNFQDSANTVKVVDFDENFAAPTPSNGKKAFDGWFTDAACTAGNEFTVPEELNADVTVYAKWKDVFVTFDAQNGTAPQQILFDDNFKLPASPSKKDWVFQGWFTDAACTAGNEWSVPEALPADVTVYAKWHQHDFGDNYLMFVECLNGCGTLGRNASTDSAKEKFVYDFTEAKKSEIEDTYTALLATINQGTDTAKLEEQWVKYDDSINYVVEQYQFGYVFYCTYNNEEYSEKFDFVSDFYNECVTNYYSLYRIIYNSAMRDFFYEGWTEEDIQQALTLSDNYGNDEYKEVNNQIDALTLKHEELISSNAPLSRIVDLYNEFVPLNNQLARLAGYNNYMDYAYASKFERYYTPEDVAPMRQYVKKYIAPRFTAALEAYRKVAGNLNDDNKRFLNACSSVSVFGNTENAQTISNLLGAYFKQMVKTDSGTPVDFYEKANAIFRDGNYYKGEQSGAYSYYISSRDTTILYFSNEGRGSSYQNAFTFAHEFGHYYNNIYNGGLSLSMDHDETQSQGDEMMFLAWLFDNKPSGVAKGYNALMMEQVLNSMATIVLATAVDEFEYAAYTGMYNGQPLEPAENGKIDYAELFETVLSSYGRGAFVSSSYNQSRYWSYVVFDQAGYYISYAMSALPSLEIYVKARENYAAAKESYLKLFTFSDSAELVHTDEDGVRTVVANYGEILNYCGLQTPFQEQMYIDIDNFLKSMIAG